MITIRPLYLILTGFTLLMLGFALPVLMIMQVIPSTFLLSFISYAASFLGLVSGLLGAMTYVARRRRR